MKRILFVCSQNKLRSPTAEQLFSKRTDIEVDSAGTNVDAEQPLSTELVQWADLIVVMEKAHRNKVQRKFKASMGNKRWYASISPTIMASWNRRWCGFLRSEWHATCLASCPKPLRAPPASFAR